MARRHKKCRYGKLKSPRGRRVCRRKPARHGRRVKARRSSSRRRCKYGFKKGTRTCRKTRRVRRSRAKTIAAQEASMWRMFRR